ncbi:hypothetical protein [Enterococcus faecalis]|uniref:hypothetical protein n=3 Tax=Enterococcus faecalis TaxID=1351 RepID=UPI000664E7E4|nr:hypothetical protein [Enterococcus faecalis]EIW2162768.1 hypothetical protein [Enterococcus faecalis]EKY7981667.1 hypothetical protein [Enterococcus faecalis]EKZ0493672.1 hypothetical protein [Enterococcus faecalis]MBJ0422661.1 hypothetical protein [Enterococcus faecalis]MBJ0476311.1 hypothetical protein [Enterococcus faecalis]
MNKEKKLHSIYMSIETKERLTRLSKEKGYRIGETLSFLLDVYDNPKKDYMEEVLSLTKQNKKLLSVIEDHVETTNILFNALAKTMELSVRENGDSLALTQARGIIQKNRESRMVAAMNQKKYSNYSVDDE